MDSHLFVDYSRHTYSNVSTSESAVVDCKKVDLDVGEYEKVLASPKVDLGVDVPTNDEGTKALVVTAVARAMSVAAENFIL